MHNLGQGDLLCEEFGSSAIMHVRNTKITHDHKTNYEMNYYAFS
jgi:hypothetical protein